MNELATHPWVIDIGWVLINFVWQAALVGLAHTLLLKSCRLSTPETRYRISMLALGLLLLLPVITAVVLMLPDNAAGTVAHTTFSAMAIDAGSTIPLTTAHPDSLTVVLLPWLVLAWVIGVMTYVLRFTVAFIGLQRIIRSAGLHTVPEWITSELHELRIALGIRRNIRLGITAAIDSPLVTGWLLPTVLLPVSAATCLTPAQIRMALLHELAHIQRNDYLVNALQVVAETLFFFHPVVHQVSRSLRREREQCCDDIVTRSCGNHLAYARLLTDLATLREHPQLAFGIAQDIGQGELAGRVQRIVGIESGPAVRMKLDWHVLVPLLIALGLLALKNSLPEQESIERRSLPLPAIVPSAVPDPIRTPEPVVQKPSRKSPGVTEPQIITAPIIQAPEVPEPLPIVAATTIIADENAAAAHEELPTSADTRGGELVHSVEPDYPRAARRHGLTGKVIVEMKVDASGRVTDARAIMAEPGEVFIDAALDAVLQWQFNPFFENGKAVERTVKQTLDFRIAGAAGTQGLQADCSVVTGTRICQAGFGNGSNVVTYKDGKPR